MSSTNPHYTFQYSQPEEYRFSHDSVFLARRVFEMLAHEDLSEVRGLDLCAGCGIIGMDFLFHCKNELGVSPSSFDFIDVQEIYRPHFETNRQQLTDTTTKLEFRVLNYENLKQPEFFGQYDLILCNPPYFQTHYGKLSPSAFKNRCRFFIDSDFRSLMEGIENSLAPGGRAFVLLRNLEDHGFNYLTEARSFLSPEVSLEKIGDIRGTDLALLKKSPGSRLFYDCIL